MPTAELTKLQRLQLLAGHYQKANRVLLQRDVFCNVPPIEHGAPAWSTDNDIYFSRQRTPELNNEADYVVMFGLNIHEVGHLKFTPSGLELRTNADMLVVVSDPYLAHVLNILEDQRMESMTVALWPSTRYYFTAAFMAYIFKHPEKAHLFAHGRRYLPPDLRANIRQVYEIQSTNLIRIDDIIDTFRVLDLTTQAGLSRGASLVTRLATILRTESSFNAGDEQCTRGTDSQTDTWKRPLPNEQEQQKAQKKVRAGEDERTDPIKKDEDDKDEDDGASPQSDEDDDEGPEGEDEEDGDDSGLQDDGGDPAEDEDEEGSSADGDDEDWDDDWDDDGTGEVEGDDVQGGDDGDGDTDDADGEADGDDGSSSGTDGGSDSRDDEGGERDGSSDASGQEAGDGSVDPTDEIFEQLARLGDEIANDPNINAEVNQARDAVEKAEYVPCALTKRHTRTTPVEPEVRPIQVKVLNELRKIEADDIDPGWNRQQSSGVLDMNRAMIRDPYDETIHRRWEEGNTYGTDQEIVLLLDRSGSMDHLLVYLSWAAWILKTVADKLGIRLTIFAFDTDGSIVYEGADRANLNNRITIDAGGGTSPLTSLQAAAVILERSRRRHKMLIIFTDGDWGAGTTISQKIIRNLGRQGVATALFHLLPGVDGTIMQGVKPNAHGCATSRYIYSMAELHLVIKDLIAQIMKGRSNRR